MWISPEWVADRIRKAKRHGSGFIGCCPAHEDHSPSFRVSMGQKATVMYCHTGCSIDEICDALDIPKSALFYEQSAGPQDDTYWALKELEERFTPPNLWELETFGDVACEALRDQTITGFEWDMSEVDAIRYHGAMWFLPYPDAMRMWSVVKAGLLFTYLRTWWEARGKPNWGEVAEAAAATMDTTWRNQ